MSRGTVEHMLKVSTKKKALGDIVARINELTEVEIDAIVTQPLWIRKCLKVHKENISRDERMKDMNIPIGAQATHEEYPVRQYIGIEEYAVTNGWGSSVCLGLSVEPNDLLMILGMGKVKVNSTVVQLKPNEEKFLIKNSESLDSMTINVYNEHLQNVLEAKYNMSSQILGDSDTSYDWASAIRIDK